MAKMAPNAAATPRMTVRAYAELLNLPAYEYLRILQEQKYPSRAPQVFRAPYYSPALSAIRRYFESGNDQATLTAARRQLATLGNEARRNNNARVIDAFGASGESHRALQPTINSRLVADIGGIQVRLSPDLVAHENGATKRIYYNCRVSAADAETARASLEISHWVLEENGFVEHPSTLEFVDFSNNRSTRGRARRAATIRRARQTAQVIAALWQAI